jgi:nucleotide-binding universal stress UspA family protein
MFKTIIWATDGSSGAEQALRYAKGVAQAAGARLIFVHVNEFAAGRAPGPVNVNEDKVQAAIGKQVADLKQEGLDAKLQLAEVMAGGAAQAIAEIADKEKADLIVVGTRGHGPLTGVATGQCHASSAAHRALPGVGRPFDTVGASMS